MEKAPALNTTSKRRACDECRLRKLACTKEPEGCQRCVRENITCHYSEQKPMGRPRKRQHNDEPKEVTADISQFPSEFDRKSHLDDLYVVNPNVDASTLSICTPSTTLSLKSANSLQDYGNPTLSNNDGAVFNAGYSGFNGTVEFGVFDRDCLVDPSLISSGVASTSSGGVSSAVSGVSMTGPACSCLASIYLAMAGLQNLPNEFSPALAVVRSAMNTAQTALRCSYCGCIGAVDPKPFIEGFQNVMLLFTVLPTIIDGYKRVLDIIDSETNIAAVVGATKIFRIDDYPGIYDHKDCYCRKFEPSETLEMEPHTWRTTVRSLVRADVYGHAGVTSGLQGLLTELEHRQRARHRHVDLMREAGTLQENFTRPFSHDSEKDAICLRMLDNTKKALSSLAIA